MEGAQAGASPTPILDRREPLPAAAGSRSWLTGLVIAGGIGALLGVGLAFGQPELLRRVEAARQGARGDVEGALRKLDEVDRGIRASVQGPGRELQLTLQERWKSELRGPSKAGRPSAK